MRRAALLLAAFLAWPGGAGAVNPDEVLADPVLEQRAREISKELRCLVCQNQSIDDSDAELAKDLRVLVRERLVAGDSDGQIMDFVVQRYGDFVLLNPPFKGTTYVLWGGPLLLIILGIAAVAVFYRKSQAQAAAARQAPAEDLSDDEAKRLARILEEPER